jgi:hypothetical protein
MPKFPKLGVDQEKRIIQGLGGTLPRNSFRANEAASSMFRTATSDPKSAAGFEATVASNAALTGEFRRKRGAAERNRRLAGNNGSPGGFTRTSATAGDMIAALPKFYDPKEYWQISGIPWDVQEEVQRKRLYEWLRLWYMTHYLIPTLIDIFTRFPLVGLELSSQDAKLTQWYEDLFLDRLDYQEFLVRLGREYWTVGQAFPLATFNDTLGLWEREELLNPDDVVIKTYPLIGSSIFEIRPPKYLVDLATTGRPSQEYEKLKRDWPDLIDYLKKNKNIPVSNQLLRQVAFRINDWDLHGTPILLRALRTLMHEEKLSASQDAIAERLYSPLILAKLGLQDIGDGTPWMPGPAETEALRDDLDMALSSDYRLLVHHFGLDIVNVFGRENMPKLGDDFDRIERRLFQLFGMNPSLLSSPSGNAQPYASSALQAEFLNQILRTYQGYLKKHYMERAKIVAEANEHYDYEKKGTSRIPIMEEKIEYDDDGTPRIVQKHKLLVPEMNMKVLDLRDEATQRQFLSQLKQIGAPISDETFMIGMPSMFKDELEKSQEEAVLKTIAQQEAKIEIYKICKARNLPIPPDILAEVQSSQIEPMSDEEKNMLDSQTNPEVPQPMGEGGASPAPLGPGGGGAPGGMQGAPGGTTAPPAPEGGAPAAQPMGAGPRGAVPEISHERTPLRPPALMSRVTSKNEDGKEIILDKIVESKNKMGISFIDKRLASEQDHLYDDERDKEEQENVDNNDKEHDSAPNLKNMSVPELPHNSLKTVDPIEHSFGNS